MKFFALVLIVAELITKAEHHSQNMPKCQMSSIFAIAFQSKLAKILFSHPLIFRKQNIFKNKKLFKVK